MLGRFYHGLLDWLGRATGLLAGLVALAVSADVLARLFGIGTIEWVLEASEYALLMICFLGAPWVLREGSHVSIDVVFNQLPPKGQRWAEIVVDVLGLCICLLLLLYAVRVTHTSWARDSMIFKEIILPEWWLLALLPFSFALLSVEFGRRLRLSLARRAVHQSVGEGL